MSLSLARVAAIHPGDHSVDLVMYDTGRRISGVQVMAGVATSSSGSHDMAVPDTPPSGDVWDMRQPTGRDIIAVVGKIGAMPIVMGFLYPQISQMLFDDTNRRVHRHASDVYSTTDSAGNTEWAHPSGTYIRVGTTPAHEDLTGKNNDKTWAITKNTDTAVFFHMQVGNAGEAVANVDIDPGGNLTISINGNAVVNVGGTTAVTSVGAAVVTAPEVTLNTPQTLLTGNLSVAGSMNVMNSNGDPHASTFVGSIGVTSGDVTADSISLKEHVHKENGTGDDTDPPTG
jgi:hypothetical protein